MMKVDKNLKFDEIKSKPVLIKTYENINSAREKKCQKLNQIHDHEVSYCRKIRIYHFFEKLFILEKKSLCHRSERNNRLFYKQRFISNDFLTSLFLKKK